MSEHTSTMAGKDADDDGASRAREPGLVLAYAAAPLASPRSFVFSGRVHVVGREPGPGGFVLAQPAVSRHHASFRVTREAVFVKDEGSRNGTWVNGERLAGDRPLSAGDDVRIGDAILVFVDDDATLHGQYRLDGSCDTAAMPITIPDAVGGLSMARLSMEVAAAARSGVSVLVLGETGVGKELVARAVHEHSRRKGSLAAVNCAALSPQLVESELFGYERGAFTGAVRQHDGLVRSADGGTLFLDEVGDLPLEAQAKLLRVLEAREVLPVGATRPIAVDVRVVCATHKDLPALVREQRFRADLYSRIAGYTIFVPPLRERKEDIALLVRALTSGLAVSFPFMAKLVRHDWPFNVRELVSVVQRAASLSQDGELRVAHLPKDFGVALAPRVPGAPGATPAAGHAKPAAPSAEALAALLSRHSGNVAAVARELERDPTQLYRWLKKFGLDPNSFR